MSVMDDKFDVVTRDGFKNTTMGWQFFDTMVEESGGLLTMIQAGWSDGGLSANTHSLAMCNDYRTWNLPATLRERLIIEGRDLMGTMWYRTEADGFDPHIHTNLIGDAPAHPTAVAQVASYRQGRNGLANGALDRNQYRPTLIRDYEYIQEEDMTPEQAKMLARIDDRLDAFIDGERKRDAAERVRDKERFRALVTKQGQLADQLTVVINKTTDDATKRDLKRLQEKVLLALKNDPDVTEEDNPSDDGLAERNMG
jgi:hypothetical protein